MANVNDAYDIALNVIERVGRALGASELVSISHAHASGISFSNIGKPGLEFIEELVEKGARVRVFATFNPVGIPLDLKPIAEYDIEYSGIEEQHRIIDLLTRMGFHFSATCIPYILRRPRFGEHLAWGESSAVGIANSFFGAYTNKEGGPLALLAAIAGVTYNAGLHVKSNRKPKVQVMVPCPKNEVDAGLLGYLVAQKTDEIPAIQCLGRWCCGFSCFKAFAAAYASFSHNAHFVVTGISPESSKIEGDNKIVVSEDEVEMVREKFSDVDINDVEVFYTGCPHTTLGEVFRIIRLVEKARTMHGKRYEVWVGVPGYYVLRRWWPEVRDYAMRRGVKLLAGTCPVVMDVKKFVDSVATDSVKAAFYLKVRHRLDVRVSTLEQYLGLEGNE